MSTFDCWWGFRAETMVEFDVGWIAPADAVTDDVAVIFAYIMVAVDCFARMAVEDGWLDG